MAWRFVYAGISAHTPNILCLPEFTDSVIVLADDLWFKAMSLLARRSVKKVSPRSIFFIPVRPQQSVALQVINIGQGFYDKQLKYIDARYDITSILKSGSAQV